MSHTKSRRYHGWLYVTLICTISLIVTCEKNNNDDDIYACIPVFKITDSIIVLNESTDKTRIELTLCNDNTVFYYTIDEHIPDSNSTVYNPLSGIVLGIGEYLIKAIGYLNKKESDIVEKKYIITCIPPAKIENFKNHTNYYAPVPLKLKNPDNKFTYETKLNDETINILESYNVNEEGFYYLEIISSYDTISRKDNYEFVILDEERGEPEWGLKAWTPKSFTESNINSEEIRIIYPRSYVKNLNIPFIIKVVENNALKAAYSTFINSVNSSVSNIKRGIGSINLLPDNSTSTISFYKGCDY